MSPSRSGSPPRPVTEPLVLLALTVVASVASGIRPYDRLVASAVAESALL